MVKRKKTKKKLAAGKVAGHDVAFAGVQTQKVEKLLDESMWSLHGVDVSMLSQEALGWLSRHRELSKRFAAVCQNANYLKNQNRELSAALFLLRRQYEGLLDRVVGR